MKIYGYIAHNFVNSRLIKLWGEDAAIHAAFETRKKRKTDIVEMIKDKFLKDGQHLIWIDDPHTNPIIYGLEQNYEEVHGVKLDGRELRQVFPF